MMEREKLGNRRKKGKDFYVGDHGVEGEIKPIFTCGRRPSRSYSHFFLSFES